MYQGAWGLWVALFFMTALGCTDFVDGWLARRYGSTVLGRLMDPIADKVFIVVAFLPYLDLKWFSWWQLLLLISREFVITALRSTYERAKVAPKTAFLAKVKTWAQMAGAGVFFMLQVIPRREMIYVLLAGAVLPVVFTLIRYFITGYIWRVSFIFGGWFLALLVPYVYLGKDFTFQFLTISILAITWLSAWTYLTPMVRMIITGKFQLADWVRLLFAILVPVLLIQAQARPDLAPWAIILAMCLEMAVGGLDTLLCVHGVESSPLLWSLRAGLLSLFSGLALSRPVGDPLAQWFLYIACAVVLWGTAVTFYRGRSYYLEEPKVRKDILGDD